MFLFVYFIFPQGHRGKGRVRGFFFDKDGNPLEGVRVKLFSLRGKDGFETATDAGGKWNIDFLKVGYEPKKISANISEVKRNPDIELRLKKIEGLVITEALKGKLAKGNKLFLIETFFYLLDQLFNRYAHLAPDFESKGRGFKSPQLHLQISPADVEK